MAPSEIQVTEHALRPPAIRWSRVLPAAAVTVAAVLVFLAFTTVTARSERRSLTLEGRLNRLAREVELALRDSGPEGAAETLERTLDGADGLLRGLVLLDGAGTVAARAGKEEGAGALEVDLFLGPGWHREERDAAAESADGTAAGGRGLGRGGRGGEVVGPGRWASRGAGMGRGRRILRLVPAAAALRAPWTERLLFPVVLIAAAGLVGVSAVGGRLLSRRQREEALEAERQRMEGLARAGAGLAHQLRTPLATIKGTAQLLAEAGDRPPDPAALHRVVEQAERMERLLGDLLDYARPPGAEPQAVVVRAVAAELEGMDPRVRLAAGPEATVRVDPEHLRQILLNLLQNALAAGPEDAPVEMVAGAGVGERSGSGGRVEITVADRGPGPGEDPERLFEPYVTARADGTGLGLPIARALARANGGDVTLAARPGGGTVATVVLPGGEGRA